MFFEIISLNGSNSILSRSKETGNEKDWSFWVKIKFARDSWSSNPINLIVIGPSKKSTDEWLCNCETSKVIFPWELWLQLIWYDG